MLPSSAKTRKAAKRKKRKLAKARALRIFEGKEDVKIKENEGSFCDEIGSPSIKDCNIDSLKGESENLGKINSMEEVVSRDEKSTLKGLGHNKNPDTKTVQVEHAVLVKDYYDVNDYPQVAEKKKLEDYTSHFKIYSSPEEVIKEHKNSLVQNFVNSVITEISVVGESITLEKNADVDKSMVSDVISFELEECEKDQTSTDNKENEESVISIDPVLKENNENDKVSSKGFTENGFKEDEGKILLQSPTGLVNEDSNASDGGKDSKIPECSANEPLVSMAPQMKQRTTFLSCCGLFELQTGLIDKFRFGY